MRTDPSPVLLSDMSDAVKELQNDVDLLLRIAMRAQMSDEELEGNHVDDMALLNILRKRLSDIGWRT